MKATNCFIILCVFSLSGISLSAQSSDFSIGVEDWLKESTDNHIAFNLKYKGKKVLVAGAASITEEDVELMGTSQPRGVKCRMMPSDLPKVARLKPGEKIRILGRYKGEMWLFNLYPVLEDCELVSGSVASSSLQKPPSTDALSGNDSSAVPLSAVCPKCQLGEFRHETKCVGYYDQSGLVDIQVAGATTSKDFVSTKSLVHAGVDLIAAEGSEVYPIAEGTVDDIISSDKDADFKSLGYMVLVAHKNKSAGKNTYSLYLHLKEKPGVGMGDTVLAGKTLLGKVGATGAAFGPHLHVEVRHFPGRFSERWKNIYGIERPTAESTYDAKDFQENWLDPISFGKWSQANSPNVPATPGAFEALAASIPEATHYKPVAREFPSTYETTWDAVRATLSGTKEKILTEDKEKGAIVTDYTGHGPFKRTFHKHVLHIDDMGNTRCRITCILVQRYFNVVKGKNDYITGRQTDLAVEKFFDAVEKSLAGKR